MTDQHNENAAGQADARRLVMVSNRLPISLEHTEEGGWRTHPAAGGVVSALDPVMRRRGGVWVGWPGVAGETTDTLRQVLDEHHNANADYRLEPVALSSDEIKGFYEGFSNEIIWPLFHNRFTACNFDPNYWQVYQAVNRRFAKRVAEVAEPDDFIWVHDYQLVNVAQQLHELGVTSRSGFFQHIPFPTADIFCNLPWWRELMHAFLSYDFIGLQTVTDRVNFLNVLTTLFDNVEATEDGQCIAIEIDDNELAEHQRELRIGALPISIDYDNVADVAASDEAAVYMKHLRDSWRDETVVVGVDRLDYTKGLPEKLEAFRELLRRHPDLSRRIVLQQLVIPSRQQVPEYEEQKAEIERLVGEINGELTRPGWVPIHYMFGRMSRAELMALFQVADIALITPLKDGMNLVAKEYCAAQLDEHGVLVLSEFAGAAEEFGDYALLVNPHDMVSTAEHIYEAYCMPADERTRRMKAMRRIVQNHTAFDWVDSFLKSAGVDE